MPRWARAGCVALSFSVALSAFAASEPSLVTGQKKSYGYSWQQELKLGADSDKEITESMGIYDDPKVQSYVEAVGQRVLQNSSFSNPNAPAMYRDTKFTFRVIDSPVVNAFALPGGYVYVTRGLLTHLDNEAQLAVVLGHEIGHVAARHSSQQARRSQWTQLGVVAGAILGQKVLGDRAADLGPALINMGGQAAQMFLLRYSREAEFEADDLGVNYAARSGYAAEQSAPFFQALKRLSASEGKALPTWQSTHPDPGDRAQRVTQIAAKIPAQARTNIGEEEYLKHVEGMVVGEDPREGFARNGVFYHPGLRFQMPVASGWKLENQRTAVLFAEPNGRGTMGLRLASGSRARDAAQQFAQQSKVQVTASGDTSVNGLPTTVIIGQADTDEGTVGVWDAFIEMDGKVYSLLGYAPQQLFDQMRPTFESVAAGFSPLRDASLASVQPSRLKLARADRNAPFASFVPTALPEGLNADEVAIMNQVGLNDPVNAGRILKVPDVPPQPAPQPEATATYGNQQGPGANTSPNGYPNRNYPSQQQQQSYPQDSRYPQQGNYPQQGGYPQQNYPQQNYPQQNYPAQTYPQQYPQSNGTNYPQQQTYPQNYPQSSTYPQDARGNYPAQNYPAQNYPQYPQQYPPSNGTNYPPQQTSPQFPQPSSSTSNQNRNAAPQQPNWPR